MVCVAANAPWRATLAATAMIAAGQLFAHAPADVDATLAGRWEIVQVVTRNDAWTPGTIRPDDPRELGQSIDITSNRLTFSQLDSRCTLVSDKNSRATLAFRRLFSGRDSPAANDVIVGHIRGHLNGVANDYAIRPQWRPSAKGVVTLMRIQCGDTNLMPWSGEQNWIARPGAAPDVLLWAIEDDSLMVLLRRPLATTASDADAPSCREHVDPSERAICADRHLRMLHEYLTSPERFIRSLDGRLSADEVRGLAYLERSRTACGGDRACLRKTLLQEVHYVISLEDRYASQQSSSAPGR